MLIESIPQFRLLPAEVRFLVWRHLVSEPLLLDFDIRSIPDDRHSEGDRYRWVAILGPYLSQRRRNLYSALQANRKSRFVALSLVPDTLAVPRGFVRFDKTRDFDGGPGGALPRAVHHLAVKGVAVGREGRAFSLDDELRDSWVWTLVATFRNIKTLYELKEHYLHDAEDKTWCVAAGKVRSEEAVEELSVEMYRRPLRSRTIWPDLVSHYEWAKSRVYPPPRDLGRMEPGFVS
ncbi:hypothetical protein MCOR30_005678 [Pyricularia oryzae]|nr:hypothetical protein MCOR30_005678 [Pyricularia oryzae]